MQSIEIANKEITYEHNIILTYKIKITKTRYINKQTGKVYEHYKIRIPSELHPFLKNKQKLYFSKKEEDIHITLERKDDSVHKCKIQRNKIYKKVDCYFNLSKKVFDIRKSTYLLWKVGDCKW
ncbi:hypothetical protein PXD04_11470 (plasmid) [Methanosphaera sp. ISO3-F5]|uniref:hypothetical protein n=1 Tax=Methanosphaera sp. ISO3-F5 TaxID=1452353 RepID=UPI002B25DBF3|nr:hypothetical protein [Methanosphaera sp. ISO3-F5]WQH65361.1 hypothetical protein PXD04_11470 [Methanosphaera sp. ISO3-F5]